MLDNTLIHNRALSAVARITLTFGCVGCIEGVDDTVDGGLNPDTDASTIPPVETLADAAPQVDPQDDAFVDPEQDAGELAADASRFEEDAAVTVDAEVEMDAGEPADASEQADAEPTGPTCGGFPAGTDEYFACCDAVNWDFNAGCVAWGPPMPPSMPKQAGEVRS